MRVNQLQLDLFPYPDIEWAWQEFLPHVRECWQLQRDHVSCGNCRDWWGSRYGDFLTRIRKMTWAEQQLRPEFKLIWEKYGHVLQGGARCTT